MDYNANNRVMIDCERCKHFCYPKFDADGKGRVVKTREAQCVAGKKLKFRDWVLTMNIDDWGWIRWRCNKYEKR